MRKYISNPRKGFSIMEVVVALVVITLVSGVVMTLITSSDTIERNTMSVLNATNLTENIIDCFRFADSKEEFEPLIEKFDVDYEHSLNIYEQDQYLIVKDNYRITFVIDYVAHELEINTVVDGEEIYSCIYTKE